MFTTFIKPIQPCPFPANLVLLCYFCSLLSPCLVCMLRMLRCYPVTLWFGISPYHYYIVFYDMIIINVDYIRRRMEGLGYPAPTLCSIRVTSSPSSGYWFLTSVPNRVWVVMGSPCLTYLASNISSGGPS